MTPRQRDALRLLRRRADRQRRRRAPDFGREDVDPDAGETNADQADPPASWFATEVPDSLNPELMFGQTATELLARIVRGEVDARRIAAKTLAARGVDLDGRWVGFAKACEIAAAALRSRRTYDRNGNPISVSIPDPE